jgi:hypothetical protein
LKTSDNAQPRVTRATPAKSMKQRRLRIRNQQVASSILAGGSRFLTQSRTWPA